MKDSISIAAPPDAVWRVLRDPALMPLWNPKCVSCRIVSAGSMRTGFIFEAHFSWRGREQISEAEIIECEPNLKLTTRYRKGILPANCYVDDSFRLNADGQATMLVHGVDFSHSGLPWLARLIMKWINVFGHSIGKPISAGVKELVEKRENTQALTPLDSDTRRQGS